MANIDVDRIEENEDRYRFEVRVAEAGTDHRYDVTTSKRDANELSSGSESPEQFVQRCFEYLLEREPADSILARFDIADIASYFPSFREEIRGSEG
jgi:hypothetical protein